MSTTPDLEALAAEITALGNRVKDLKTKGDAADEATVKTAVERLLEAKRTYAAHNDGMGPDGQPFVEKMTKAQKKAAAAAAAAAHGGTGQQQQQGPAKPVSAVVLSVLFLSVLCMATTRRRYNGRASP